MNLNPRGFRRSSLLLLAVLVAAAGLVACGGDDGPSTADKNEYTAKVNQAQTKFADGVQKLGFSGSSSASDVKKSLEGLDPLLDEIVSDLESIDPPDEVQAEHDKMIAAVRDYQKAANESADGLADRDPEAAQSFSEASQRFSTEFDRAVDQINTKLRE